MLQYWWFPSFPTVSSAEDPEKLLDQVVNEMQEDLIKMRQAAAQVGRRAEHPTSSHPDASTPGLVHVSL
jgi:phage shock protein A